MTQREHIGVDVPGGSLRATLDLPRRPSGPRVPVIVIDRGPGSGESDSDVLEALGAALAEAGMLAVRIEPRVSGLILEDFERFSAADAVADLTTLLQVIAQRGDVDAARIGVVGWSIGSLAAQSVALRSEAVSRLCMINPITAEALAASIQTDNGQLRFAGEAVPRAFIAGAASAVLGSAASTRLIDTLIIHAAADCVVAPEVSLAWLRSLERSNARSDRMLVARADHVFSAPAARQALLERVTRFFSEPASAAATAAPVAAGASA